MSFLVKRLGLNELSFWRIVFNQAIFDWISWLATTFSELVAYIPFLFWQSSDSLLKCCCFAFSRKPWKAIWFSNKQNLVTSWGLLAVSSPWLPWLVQWKISIASSFNVQWNLLLRVFTWNDNRISFRVYSFVFSLTPMNSNIVYEIC